MKRTNSFLNIVAAAFCAFALTTSFQSCAIVDNPSGDDPVVDDGIKTANELIAAIGRGDQFIKLAPGATITLTDKLVIPQQVVITGDEKNLPTIFANQGIEFANNFAATCVNFDGTNNTNALLTLAAEPVVETLPGSEYYLIQSITLMNCRFNNIKGSIIWDSNVKYCVQDLTICDCGFILNTESTNNQAFFSFQGGGVKDFYCTYSTFSQKGEAENNYFLRYNNSARLDRYGYDKETNTQSINYINNTFYKVCTNGQWGNYNGYAGQKYTAFTVTGNIWVDCGNNQVPRRILGGRNANSYNTCVFFDNSYWYNNMPEQGIENYDETGGMTCNPMLKDPENGDFTPTGEDQVAKKTGDPHWYK